MAVSTLPNAKTPLLFPILKESHSVSVCQKKHGKVQISGLFFQEKCMVKCKQRFKDWGNVVDNISVTYSDSNGNMCSYRRVA